MTKLYGFVGAALCSFFLFTASARAGVIINEIMYHPVDFAGGDETPLAEYIELHNTNTTFAFDVTGWRITKGADFLIPAALIAPGGYLVVAADGATFAAKYPGVTNFVSGWSGKLANSGERIKLVDPIGGLVDEVSYSDQGDWAGRRSVNFGADGFGLVWETAADGQGASLELINTAVDNSLGANWGASLAFGGTPGAANSIAASDTLPIITEVIHSPAVPSATEPVTVSAIIHGEIPPGGTVNLRWRRALGGDLPYTLEEMADLDGDGVFAAIIIALEEGVDVEYYIEVLVAGDARVWPMPTALGQRKNAMFQVDSRPQLEAVATYRLIMTADDARTFENRDRDSDALINATLIVSSGSGDTVRHLCGFRARGNSSRNSNPPPMRVNVPRDRPINGETKLNINSRYSWLQTLGMEMFAEAGMAAPHAKQVEFLINGVDQARESGSMHGSYVHMQPIGDELIDQDFPNDSGGNLYKKRSASGDRDEKRWGVHYENNVVYGIPNWYRTDNWSKLTNEDDDDWTDLQIFAETMHQASGETYLDEVGGVVDIDQWVRWFAIMTFLNSHETNLSNGIDDDYSMYRGKIDPRFKLLPHDLDTIFDKGDTGSDADDSIFPMLVANIPRASEDGRIPQLIDFFAHPVIRKKYFYQIQSLLSNEFSKPNLDNLIYNLLGDWVAAADLTDVIAYADARRTSMLAAVGPPLEWRSFNSEQNGFRFTTVSGVELVGIYPVADASTVMVNGQVAEIFPVSSSWSVLNFPLLPGINRITVEALDADGIVSQTTEFDLWFATGSTTPLGGTISVDTLLPALGGPYEITDSLIVAPGATLTIEAGTNIYIAEGKEITVNGALRALGTRYAHVRICPNPTSAFVPDPVGNGGLPSSPPKTRGVQFVNSMSDQNLMRYVDILHAQSVDGSVGVHQSEVVLDHMTFAGTHLRMLYADRSSVILQNSIFPDMFALGESPDALQLDNISEHVKAEGAYPLGGHFIIRNNVFGTNAGHNDVVDVDSGRRPDPILQVLDNTFLGAGDEALDLGGDVYVAGNLFMNIFKDDETSDRGYANAISTGDAGDGTTIVAVRNVFWNVDHAINLKTGTATIFENNTVVKIHDDFDDRFGNPNVGSAINFYVDEPGAQAGDGAYAGNNIFSDSPRIFGNADRPGGTQTPVQLDANLMTSKLADRVISSRIGTARSLDPGSLVGSPGFVDEVAGHFELVANSAGVGAGTAGQDLGAFVPDAISITGEPPAITVGASATLSVGGPGMFAFKYSVDGGAEIGPLPIGNGYDPVNGTRRVELIELTNLAPGMHSVSVVGQDYAGNWQVEPTVSKTWMVDLNHSQLVINEVSAAGETIELYNAGLATVDLSGMSLSDRSANNGDFVIPTGTSIQGRGFISFTPDTFGLDKDGDSVVLFNSAGTQLDRVDFGSQLTGNTIGRFDGEWALTVPTPNAANIRQPLGDPRGVMINEWLSTSEFRFKDDFIELFNPSSWPVAIGGFYLSDDPVFSPEKFQISALSFIAGDGYGVYYSDASPAGNHLPFNLSAVDERVRFSDGNLSVIDEVHFQCETTDVSQGRLPDGAGRYIEFSLPTPGMSNSGESVGLISEIVVPLGAVWRYEESDVAQPTSWILKSFDDNAWGSGPGLLWSETEPLNGPGGTPLLLNPPATHYFRHGFIFTGNPDEATFEFDVFVDDGAIIYINEVEAMRIRMTTGAVNHSTRSAFSMDDANREGPFLIPASLIKAGRNVIAVEVHQAGSESSDVVFGMELRANREVAGGTDVAAVAQEMLDSLRVTEIMFNPVIGGSEFIEIQNTGDSTLNLEGVRFTDGIEFTFPAMQLGPGRFVVVVENLASFEAEHGATVNVAGQFSGKLSNSGERIILQLPEPYEAAIMCFDYDDHWFPDTDGGGSSLEIVDETAPINTWPLAGSWQASTVVGGTPAQVLPPVIDMLVNASTTLGDAFAYQMVASNNPQSYGAAGLPAGIVVNPQTGLITGSAQEYGAFSVTVSATNAAGSDSSVLQINVASSTGFSHFKWDPITGLQPSSTEFPVTIRAVDSAGRAVVGFNRFIDLNAVSSPTRVPGIVVTECTDRTRDTVEFMNVTSEVIDTRGWRLVVNDPPGGILAVLPRLCPLPASMEPGRIVFRTDSSGNNFFGLNIRFQHTFENGNGQRGWAMILDDDGAVVDFVIWGYAGVDLDATRVTINGRDYTLGDYWEGSPMFWASASGRSLQRLGNSDSDTLADWDWSSTSRGTAHPALSFPFAGQPTSLPLTPNRVSMIDGVWTGLLTIDQEADNVFLLADSFDSESAGSNEFDLRDLADADADGLPDSWEEGNGLNPAIKDGELDLDGDGQSNLAEYLASTDPQDAASVFRVRSIEELDDGDVRIEWNSVRGARYRVMVSADLASWLEIPNSRVVGRSAGSSFRHKSGRNAARHYYRVEASVHF